MPEEYLPIFSGNTYVQNKNGTLASWCENDYITEYNISLDNIEDIVRNNIGDEIA